MFIAANFIAAAAEVIGIALNFYMWVIIIRALISWVNPDPYNPIVQFLYKVTEPVLHPIRRLMPAYNIGIDLSPLIVILIIIFLRSFLVSSLVQLAQRMPLQ
jgi:YggT family protein